MPTGNLRMLSPTSPERFRQPPAPAYVILRQALLLEQDLPRILFPFSPKNTYVMYKVSPSLYFEQISSHILDHTFNPLLFMKFNLEECSAGKKAMRALEASNVQSILTIDGACIIEISCTRVGRYTFRRRFPSCRQIS